MDQGPPSPAVWQDGALRSALYGDIYFSGEDGLAETRAVFLDGCGLPQAWAGRNRFIVGELGFGTGLNIAALLDLWSREGSGGHLHIFSIEAHPLEREDARRALMTWPQLEAASSALLDRWPGRRRGFHRIDLPGHRATLDLAVMESAQALVAWQGRADAWFLDGFSPASNPAMWRDEVLDLIAARSAPGARAATFTVAGAVRRGLSERGFAVERKPGFGRKKQRLEARLPGQAADTPAPGSVAVIGGGIAGASLARAFRALGCEARVFDAGSGEAASGNPAAMVTPGLDAGGGPRARLYAEAFTRALQLYDMIPDAVIARGVVKVESEARDERRLTAVAGQAFFEPGTLRRCTGPETAGWLDEGESPGGLMFETGLTVEPAKVREAWLSGVAAAQVTGLEPEAGGWRLDLEDGSSTQAGVVVIAGGWGSAALWPGLTLEAIRGQASWAAISPAPRAASFGGYTVPTRTGVLFGATFDRDDIAVDVRNEDHQRNLAQIRAVRPRLAARIDPERLEGRAAMRASAPDQLPLAGEAAPGLFVLTGLGSRGFATAPLLAEHVAALAMGAPSPLAADLAVLVEPFRF